MFQINATLQPYDNIPYCPEGGNGWITACQRCDLPTVQLSGAMSPALTERQGISEKLKRHSFSELVASVGELLLLHTP